MAQLMQLAYQLSAAAGGLWPGWRMAVSAVSSAWLCQPSMAANNGWPAWRINMASVCNAVAWRKMACNGIESWPAKLSGAIFLLIS